MIEKSDASLMPRCTQIFFFVNARPVIIAAPYRLRLRDNGIASVRGVFNKFAIVSLTGIRTKQASANWNPKATKHAMV